MKKLYSIALAVAVALGASAQAIQTSWDGAYAPQDQVLKTTVDMNAIQVAHKVKALKADVPAKAAAIDLNSLYGPWFWDCANCFSGEAESKALLASSSIIPKTIKLDIIYMSGYPINATIDVNAGTLTLKANQKIGQSTKYGNVTLKIKTIVPGENKVANWPDRANTTAEYVNGTFVFPEDVFIGAFVSHPTEGEGFLDGWVYCAMGITDLTEWEDYGTAAFVDGWMLGPNAQANAYEVDVQVDKNIPGRFRLVNPYQKSPVTDNLDNEAVGSIVFDITNPDVVTFDCRYYSGYTMEEIGKTYIYDLDGWLCQWYGWDTESLAQNKSKLEIEEFTTYKDNVVTVPNGNAGIGGSTGSIQNQDGTTHSINPFSYLSLGFDDNTSKIIFNTNGVNDALIADLNAPVEYFNLQGVRVANPENGLYIRRQGNKAAKVYVK